MARMAVFLGQLLVVLGRAACSGAHQHQTHGSLQ